MASEKRHNGGGTGPFTFNFPSLEQSDIKVSVSNVELTSGFSINNYDPMTGGDVTFTSNTASGTNNVRIYRQTEPETLAATFVAGSSIRANDLNNCNKQTIFLADENRTSINSLALGDSGSAIVISGTNIADNSISSSKILDLEVKTADINNLAVTAGKLADTAVTAGKLADTAVTTAKIADTNVTTAKIADGAVTQTKINSAVIFTPVGTVITYAGSSAPTGYLKSNGDTIPNGSGTVQGVTADFSTLYAVVGATLPDLRGEFIRGFSDGRTENGSDVDPNRLIRSTQTDDNKQHNHSIDVSGTTSNKSLTGSVRRIGEGFRAQGTTSGVFTKVNDGNNSITESSSTSPVAGFTMDASHDHTFDASGTSGDRGSESRPRNVALLMCIKY